MDARIHSLATAQSNESDPTGCVDRDAQRMELDRFGAQAFSLQKTTTTESNRVSSRAKQVGGTPYPGIPKP